MWCVCEPTPPRHIHTPLSQIKKRIKILVTQHMRDAFITFAKIHTFIIYTNHTKSSKSLFNVMTGLGLLYKHNNIFMYMQRIHIKKINRERSIVVVFSLFLYAHLVLCTHANNHTNAVWLGGSKIGWFFYIYIFSLYVCIIAYIVHWVQCV